MEFLADSFFTETQSKIIASRKEGKTYSEIITGMNIATGFNTTPKHISTCLTRSALECPWNYEQPGGNPPFLCHDDMIKPIHKNDQLEVLMTAEMQWIHLKF